MIGILFLKISFDIDSDFKVRNRIIFVEAERREEIGGVNEDMFLKRKYKKGGNKGKIKV